MFLCLVILVLAPCCLSSALVKRMAGGEPGEIEDYPHLVFVGSPRFICTGAMLSKHYVLTAGHCIRTDKNMIVRAGSKYRGRGGSVHHIEKTAIHENYYVDDKKLKSFYDIAVIRVREPFIYDNTRQPIRLADRGYKVQVNATAKGAGWGGDENKIYSIRFSKMDLHIIDRKSCNETFKSWGGIEANQFCATTDNQKVKYFCNGDSGSSLVINNRTVGVAIYGGGCELADSPVVFTDVGFFRDWIDAHVIYDEPENVQQNIIHDELRLK